MVLKLIRSRRAMLIGAGLALVAGLVSAVIVVATRPDPLRVTAYFRQTVSVFPDSDVRILGVRVGRVDSVRPQGQQVKVTLSVDHGVDVPAGAVAVVVAPSVVADRYVQLAPAYTGGPRLADHSTIPVTRTAVPMEIDQLFDSIVKFMRGLGPNGVNRNGALSDVLNTGAANLLNNGKEIGDAFAEFGKATQTLNGSRDDFFTTFTNLQKFTTMLKANDDQVRMGEERLASVNGFLAEDRANLGAALRNLGIALAQMQRFIHDNRARLKSNVAKLASITQTLVNERRSLAEAFDTAPLAADNVLKTYDPAHRVLTSRGDLNELSMGGPLTQSIKAAQSQVCAVTDGCSPGGTDLKPVSPAQRAELPPLALPPVGPVFGTGGS